MMLENVLQIQGFLLFLVLPLLLYWYFSSVSSYWKKRGIWSTKPKSILMSYFFPPKKPAQVKDVENYKQGRIYGEFSPTLFSAVPALAVGDPNILRDILIKDFSTFPNRKKITNPDEVFRSTLTNLEDEDWKRVRSLVTPTFSTAKIKQVLSIFKDSSKTLIQNFKMAIEKGNQIELNKLYGTFTMDTIASAAFSTKIESYNDPENIFVKKARQSFRFDGLIFLLSVLLPFPMIKILKKFMPTSGDFFKEVTLKLIDERKRTGQRRNDFLQLLIDASKQELTVEKEDQSGKIDDNYDNDTTNHLTTTTSSKNLSKNEIVAQCIVFFIAGYHTSSLTLSFATHLLAVNQEAQEKVYEELKAVLKETNGVLTYDALQRMKYLDNVIAETLRIYPPAVRFARTAAADYTLGNTGIVVPKGMVVNFPVYAMHHDPEFFPDPERFDPDRFSPEQKSKQIPYTYMPFGAGPRNCIGMRFALLEMKVCLAYVLSVYHIKKSPETKDPPEFHASISPLLVPKDLIVQMSIRENCPLKE